MQDNHEERYSRKIRGLAFRSAWAGGIGLGALIVRFLFPLFTDGNDDMNAMLAGAGTILLGGAVINFLMILFARKKAVLAGMVVSWLIVPGLLVRLWMKTMM